MIEWEEVRLGDIAIFRNGLNFSNKSHGDGCKIIGIPDFGDRLIPDYESLGEINPEGVVKSDDYLKQGDIIFVRSNGNKNLVGRSLFINQRNHKLVYSGFCIRARFLSDKFLPLFYAYFFRTSTFRKLIAGAAGGANIQNLNQGTLSRAIVPFPSLPIQRRIASILSFYDDLIENNLKRIKLLEELAQRTYEEWFVKFRINGEALVIDGKTGLPVGWEKKKLKALCEKIADGTHDSPKPSNTGYKLITGKHLMNGDIDFESAYLISKEDHLKIKQRSGLEKKDILFSNIGTLGNVGMVTEDFEYSCKNMIIFRPLINHEYFLFAYLMNTKNKERFLGQSSGSTQKFISLNYIRAFEDLLPNVATIANFNDKVKHYYGLINNLYNQNNLLKQSRDILLARLMNGTISVAEGEVSFALGAS